MLSAQRRRGVLLKRSEAAGSYPGRWGGVAGHAESDPDVVARREIHEETGVDPDRRWIVHPYTVGQNG